MKSPQMSTLSKEAVQEFGALLLLDHLMRYELLQIEKVELEDIIDPVSYTHLTLPTIYSV